LVFHLTEDPRRATITFTANGQKCSLFALA
jgi:hypothetical protein